MTEQVFVESGSTEHSQKVKVFAFLLLSCKSCL